MAMYQIDGISGTGKTTLAEELIRRGYKAIDADEEFGYFGDPKTGKPTDQEIQDNWLWDTDRIKKLAAETSEDVFLCGGAMNQNDIIKLFDKRFTLIVDDETMKHRLLNRTNNSFGKDPKELTRQLEWNKGAAQYAESIGSIPIDATKPIEKVADQLLSHVSGKLEDKF